MNHGPGRAAREADGWHLYCTCGDQTCAEEWDYTQPYLAQGTPEALGIFAKEVVRHPTEGERA